jgi:hypothetical protein
MFKEILGPLLIATVSMAIIGGISLIQVIQYL